MLTDNEVAQLIESSRAINPTENVYVTTDYVTALLETVVDYQMQTTAVERAMNHFVMERRSEVGTHEDLKACLARYPDTREGNIDLAVFLWGYRLWTRAAQLRRLLEFFEVANVRTLDELRAWAEASTFDDFRGQVKGLGPAVYQWLVMRLGRATIKPDVHVLRFVGRAIGRPVDEAEAIDGLERAASTLGIRPNVLDWSIWESQRAT